MNPTQPQSQIPEGQVTSQMQQQVAPDVSSPQGQQQLFQKAVQSNVAKKTLDAVLEAVSQHLGGSFSTRVKSIETAGKKIAQKRMEGRDYGIEDLNDYLGGRITIKSENDLPKAKDAMKKLSDAGVFKIDKSERVTKGTYSAWHVDTTMGNGTRAEIQIMTKKQEAESLINHSLRAQYGEKPQDKAVQQLRDKQASMINSMPDDKAQAIAEAMKGIMKQNKDQPVQPQVTAQLLAQAQ